MSCKQSEQFNQPNTSLRVLITQSAHMISLKKTTEHFKDLFTTQRTTATKLPIKSPPLISATSVLSYILLNTVVNDQTL